MTIKITFTDLSNSVHKNYYPVPAKHSLPNWYKQLPSYEGTKEVTINNAGLTNATAKKCMPMFDAMSSGYLIKTHNDLNITRAMNGEPFFHWPDEELIRFHSRYQAATYASVPAEEDVPKFINPWAISTPSGYSCWFKNPSNNDNSPFEIFEGVVDTDIYKYSVHLPFLLRDRNFVGLIPAGTVIAQVIPFKRDSFVMSLGSEKDRESAFKSMRQARSGFFNVYKNLFWSNKEYR